jgi:Putative auto-transporter adhesin, head GIN domain
MKTIVIAFLFSFVAFAAVAQEKLKPFTSINAFGPFEIELISSDTEAIEMETINADEDDFLVEVNRGELQLKFKSIHYFTDRDYEEHKKGGPLIKTKIYYKELDELHASAGAVFSSKETIRNKKIIITAYMGSEMKLTVVSETIFAKASMGAVINLSGRTDFLEVKAYTGGVIKATRLEGKSAYVKASIGSDVSVMAVEEIDIDASLGSYVKYTGDPKVIHTNRKLGAEIRQPE